MKRFLLVSLAIVTSVLGLGLPASALNLNNFIIKDYQVDMVLTQDEEGRARLKTMETITAVFPDFDQNHGIERSLVDRYDGHTTNLKVESVTDAGGQPRNYKMNNSNILRIGDSDKYLHGEQTFIIKYSQRDVTRFFEDTGVDEFYWDAIGTEWLVPVESAQISIDVDKNLASNLTGETRCYKGGSGSNELCQSSSQTTESGGKLLNIVVNNLSPGEGVTIAVGFTGKTFVQPPRLPWNNLIELITIINYVSILPASIVGFILLFVQRKKSITPEIKSILNRATVPQYLPPEGYNVLQSNRVMSAYLNRWALSGHIIDWAVQHYVIMRQMSEAGFLKKADYDLEIIQEFPENSPISMFTRQIFDGAPDVGKKISTKEIQTRAREISMQLQSNHQNILSSDLFYINPQAERFSKVWGKALMIVGFVVLNFPTVAVGFLIYMSRRRRHISLRGAELKKYLQGLKMYIGVAEEERLRMLQSPETVEKVGDVAHDKSARLKLYERLLPYAILFGQEKSWAKQLGDLYTEIGQSPEWNSSLAGFSAGSFASSLGSFTANISEATSYSSSSSGSTGGGSAGGGGGGGGGGGW